MDGVNFLKSPSSPKPPVQENRKKLAKQDKLDAALSVGRSHFYADLDRWTDKVLRKGVGEQDDEFVDWIKVEDQDTIHETSLGSQPVSLALGDRIVWISAEGKPEYGTVRWIGVLPGARNDYHAGIEFDHPIGGGTGRYHGRELFCTNPNHASLVPIIGLIRAQDFAPSDPRSRKPAERKDPYPVLDQSQIPLSPLQQSRQGNQALPPHSTPHAETRKFSLATCVEVSLSGVEGRRYGVVRFFGKLPLAANEMMMAGIELEDDLPVDWGMATNGSFNGKEYFTCPERKGIFVPASQLKPDRRFNTSIMSMHEFGSLDSGMITEYQAPGGSGDPGQLSVVGKHRGIQGHRNSCYLDATLYAMFCHTPAFDKLLLRPQTSSDIKDYTVLRDLLAMEIVYPLRRNNYVRADHVVRLRQLLSRLLPDMAGLTEDEKDPEELLNALLRRLLRPSPFLHICQGSSEEKSYLCQLINDEDEATCRGVKVPTVQQLLENSFFQTRMKLKRIPSCFIVQLPRYGKQKIYEGIVPSLTLDLTHVMAESPRPCRDCERLAECECRECFLIGAESLADVTFCTNCFKLRHGALPNQANDHCPSFIDYSATARHAVHKQFLPIPAVSVELVSVLCIETSHYVAFTRVGGEEWVFFDSMADRKGASEGYNIPEVSGCPEIGRWLSSEGAEELRGVIRRGRVDSLPRYLQRLLNDCYICFYAWPEGEVYADTAPNG